MIAFSTTPILHQNKPARESIFCGRTNNCWEKQALIMLKFAPKNWQVDELTSVSVREFTSWQVNEFIPFSRHNHILPQTKKPDFQKYRAWVRFFVMIRVVCLGFTAQKQYPLSQFIEITKVKTASISEFNLTFNFSTTKYCKLELFYLTLRHKRKFRSHVFV